MPTQFQINECVYRSTCNDALSLTDTVSPTTEEPTTDNGTSIPTPTTMNQTPSMFTCGLSGSRVMTANTNNTLIIE